MAATVGTADTIGVAVNEREEKKPGKGRPNKIYSLKVCFDEIVDELEKQQRKAADEARSRIERLRKSRKY